MADHEIWVISSFLFWTPGLPEGVLSNRPCPSVVRSPSLNISETTPRIFLIFCKLVDHKGTKVTEPDF